MSRQIGSKRSPEAVQILLGKRLRALRSVRGFRQEAIEARGLNYKYLQRIEAGRCNLTLRTLQRVASVLEVKVEDLFQFPLGSSPHLPEAQEVVGLVIAMIAGQDKTALKKLQVFIKEILPERGKEKSERTYLSEADC
ncbi:MAG TPA: helix-turn-helix transcriptional regulator [Patescibacteria group bacterium]|nr:helix-turn-helix transcriptional regulator [Patescibacteria group bacterium]